MTKQELITLIEKMRTFLEEGDEEIQEVLSSVASEKELRAAFVACNNPVSLDYEATDNVIEGYFQWVMNYGKYR